MAEEVDKMITALNGSNDKNGREDVKDRNKDLPPAQLKPQEQKRIFNIGTVIANALFDVQKKREKDTFGATDTPAAKAEKEVIKSEEKKKKPFKIPLLATLAIGITAFATWLSDFFGPVGEFFSKTLPKLFKPVTQAMGKVSKLLGLGKGGGKIGMTLAKMAGKIGKRILKFGRFIPFIGSLFNFGFAISRFKNGEIIPGIFEIVSGLLNLTGVGAIPSMLIDGALLMYDLNKDKGEDKSVKPKGGEGSLWDKIYDWAMGTPVISNIMSLGKGWIAVFKGKWSEAADHFDKAMPWVGAVIGWIADAAEGAGKWFSERNIDVRSPGEFFTSVVDKFVSMFTDMVKSIYNWVSDKATAIVENVKEFGGKALETAKGLGKGVANFFLPKKYEFQDFSWLARGNKAIPFSSEDDVIGMKPGGVLDKVFSSIGKSLDLAKEKAGEQRGFLNKVLAGAGTFLSDWGFKGGGGLAQDFLGVDEIVNEIKRSNMHLSQLVQLTSALVAGQGQNGAGIPPVVAQRPNPDMSGEMGAPSYSDGRIDFTNSAYSMHTV